MNDDISKPRHTVRDILADKGITTDAIIGCAMELYCPHPGVETRDIAESVFTRELDIALSDPNLCLLIYAGVLLEEKGEAGQLPDISPKGYEQDMTFLIADEVLGMTISKYIGGHKGSFEYVRFDKVKPGILSTLGPFLDDVIAGLVGGASANMYSRGRDGWHASTGTGSAGSDATACSMKLGDIEEPQENLKTDMEL